MSALHKTYIVSFPRSGQHLLIRGLMWVMPDAVVYSENYKAGHHFADCPAVNIQKEHDFDLTLEKKPEFKYIVLYREWFPAIKSWWHMTVRNGMPDTEENFREFLKGKSEYYAAFREKWVRQIPAPNQLLIDFDGMRRHPAVYLKTAVDFVVRELPQEHSFDDANPLAYETFEIAVKRWMENGAPVFQWDHILYQNLNIVSA